LIEGESQSLAVLCASHVITKRILSGKGYLYIRIKTLCWVDGCYLFAYSTPEELFKILGAFWFENWNDTLGLLVLDWAIVCLCCIITIYY
jgi:hypothetical protein